MKELTVLSLCDGMSCGQIALVEEGFAIKDYYASEIETNAIKVTQENFPDTKQVGDIRSITGEMLSSIGNVDLVLCGFPCNDVSRCTRQGGSQNWNEMHKKGKGINGEKSALYFEFIRIYNILKSRNPDIKFLVENVPGMTKTEREIVNNDLGVNGIIIDSALFSAQERKRIYWTNIEYEPIPNGNNCTIKDILDKNVPESFYEKREFIIKDNSAREVGELIFNFKAHDIVKRVYGINYKSPTLTACRGGNLQKKIYINGRCRKLTPHEYRKLQTIPDWYKMSVSNGQIYNLCGEGWTVAVIRHILRGLSGNTLSASGGAQE